MPLPIEASIDLSFYEPQLKVLQADPNTRIVGSLGRMAAYQQALGNPYQEFEERYFVGIHTNRVSDIDVLGTSDEVLATARAIGGAQVDDTAFRDSDVTVENDDGTWYLKSPMIKFKEKIHPEVMRPIKGIISGVEIVTVPLLTHNALHSLRNRDTKKDRVTDSTIGFVLHRQARAEQRVPLMPREHALPFMKLQNRLHMHQVFTLRYNETRHSV